MEGTDPGSDHPAQVILLTGPSGCGKSRFARASGLPRLELDHFYRNHDEPGLPMLNASLVDWDDPASWDADAAMEALTMLCRTGEVVVPTYDISRSARVGSHTVRLGGARRLVAEGIFAAELVDRCRDAGILEAAICIRRPSGVTFAHRLVRDLRQHRKPPHVLVTRGWHLMRTEPAIVSALVDRGCEPMSPRRTRARLAGEASR